MTADVTDVTIISRVTSKRKAEGRYTMKKLARQVEDLFLDITFAEEREFRSAREALRKFEQKIEDTFTAIAFAEAGEFETAASYINKDGEAPKSRHAGCPTRRFIKLCTGRA